MLNALLSLSLSTVPLPLAQEVDLTEREKRFQEHFGSCLLEGSFTLDSDTSGELRRDVYEIQSVEKQADGRWMIKALVGYTGRKVPFSLPVPVEWAGDTPVLSITELPIPLMGTYSARVVIDGERYAGTWSGAGYGGHLFGYIRKPEKKEPQEEAVGRRTDMGRWPQFRGEGARGVAEGHRTVASFDTEKERNVRWRTKLPGMAHSSPVIWDEEIFLTSAVRKDGDADLKVGLYGSIASLEDEGEHDFTVMCIDKRSGEVKWERTAWSGTPSYPRHPKGSFAASTPATDGKRVVAFYGVEGLYCFDLEGELSWKKDMGELYSAFFMMPASSSWGFASSPVLFEDKLLVQCDVMEGSYLTALDPDTGEEIWRTERDEIPTWSTPTVHVGGGRRQVICNGFKHIGGYDLDTGEELWKLVGGGDIPVPTPIVAHDTIYITNSHGRMRPIYAIDVEADGELDIDPEKSEFMRWSYRSKGVYMQTPIAVGDFVYFCSNEGVVRCMDALTGEEVYRERLGSGRSGFTSSAVAADGKLYFSSEDGNVYVVREGWEFEVLAESSLGEEMMSTPAVSEGVIYFRTRNHLTAVGRPDA